MGRKRGGSRKRKSGRLGQRGLFDAPILIGFYIVLIISVSTVISLGLPEVLRSAIIPGMNLPGLMVHIPGIEGYPFYTQAEASSPIAPNDNTSIYAVSKTMGRMYDRLQVVALAGFVIVFIIIGIVYVSEQFSFVSRGTALQLLSESGLILALLFLFPLIYNGSAALLNGLNQSVILKVPGKPPGTAIQEVALASANIGLTPETSSILGSVAKGLYTMFIGRAIVTLTLFTATFGALLTVMISGIMRLLLIAVLVGMFPLILIFRLIPPLRGIATQLQGALVGLMVGTVLVSVLFRVAYDIVAVESSPVMKWVLGVGTLTGASALMFAFASGFGKLAGLAQGAVVGPVAGVMGGMIASAGGAALGAPLGMAGVGLRAESFKELGRAALSGAKAGATSGSPLGAIMAAPIAGKGASDKWKEEQILKEAASEQSPPFDEFLDDERRMRMFIAGRERHTDLWEQEATAGAKLAADLMEGRWTTDMLARAYVAASGRAKNRHQFEARVGAVMRTFDRHSLEKSLQDAYHEVISRRAAALRAKGEEDEKSIAKRALYYANAWLRTIYNRAKGEEPFAQLQERLKR